MTLIVDIAMVIAAGLGVAGWFAASTTLGGQYPDAVLLAWGVLLAAPFVLALSGLPSPRRLRRADRSDVLSASIGGVLVFAAAPLLVLACRLTDAPSGSESLFFTTAAWAVLTVAAGALVVRDVSLTQAGGSLLALLGAAAVVANWERPSSFSPFVKFPLLEAGMLVAGVLFAAGTVLLHRASRSSGPRLALSVAWASATVCALAAVMLSGGTAALFTVPSFVLPQLALGVLSTAAFGVAWVFALARVGVARSASGLFLPTLVLMGVAATEGVTHAYGADPVQWPAALAGAVTLASGAIILYSLKPGRREALMMSGLDRTSVVAGGIGIALGAAGLFMPAFGAQISGEFGGQAFEASWMMIGAESAGGWLPLVLSGLLVAAAIDASGFGWGRRQRLGLVAAVVLSCALWPLLATTPLRTWTRWIPAEVLQDLGTEYAHMSIEAVSQPLAIVALVVILGGAACLSLGTFVWAATVRRAEGRA